MGEVYRARDTILKREVAVKILPDSYSSDPERLRRFQQEAEAAAALNHPNILTVHQVGQQDGISYIVTELLQGDTLRQKLRGGPLPVRIAIDYAVQIARGLATAHEKGIVHRDLKPENLFVTRDDRIKILDFGLAKLTQPQPNSVASLRTVSEKTTPGEVMGTVGYMSPEQVRGQPANPRSDIFAFGAVLFEILTGKRAFQGATSADTMSAILLEDPPRVSQIVPGIPPGLERVVHRCLEKNPEQRFQSASDLAFALHTLSDSSGMSVTMAPGKQGGPRRMSARVRLIAIPSAVVAALLLAIAGYFYFHRAPKLTTKDTLVLADFVNATGDPVFDDTLKQALSIQLEQSPFLRVLSYQGVRQTLKLMGRPPNEKLTQDIAMEVCLRSNSKAVLSGSIAEVGSHYSLNLKALNCQSGDTLASIEAEADSREKVLHTLGEAGDHLRAKMGESLASVERDSKPVEEATTNSLEALRAYTQGRLIQYEQGTAEAVPYYKRAIELDPNFARAYAALGSMYTTVG
jgi:serine/threonine protein kinase